MSAAVAAAATPGWLAGATQGATAAAGGVQAASGLSSMFIGKAGRIKRYNEQIDAQEKMNENAARINYEYGEAAAKNAYARQMEAFQTQIKENSPEAVRKRLEEAGLNPALMYGGGNVGGTTAMTPQQHGATGGASAGSLHDPSNRQMAAANTVRGGTEALLNAAMIGSQIKLANSQAEKNNAEAENLRGVDRDVKSAMVIEIESRVKTEGLRQEGLKIANQIASATSENQIAMSYENLRKLQRENKIGEATEEDLIMQQGTLETIRKIAENEKLNKEQQLLVAQIAEAWIKVNNWEEYLPPLNRLFETVSQWLKGGKPEEKIEGDERSKFTREAMRAWWFLTDKVTGNWGFHRNPTDGKLKKTWD